MNKKKLIEILHSFKNDNISINEILTKLQNISFENIGCAHIDHNRSFRKGFPEVIFAQKKTSSQIIKIMETLLKEDETIIASRLNISKAKKVTSIFPDAKYYQDAKMLVLNKKKNIKDKKLLIISAGTSDIPVAKEAEITIDAMGYKSESIYDVGVAGINRLLHYREKIEKASVIIAIAGMEGALPSVVAGLTAAPVIAVPTSVGYGASLNGLTPLFAMLNSCSSNVAVVNIDNGFGAAYFAFSILKKITNKRSLNN